MKRSDYQLHQPVKNRSGLVIMSLIWVIVAAACNIYLSALLADNGIKLKELSQTQAELTREINQLETQTLNTGSYTDLSKLALSQGYTTQIHTVSLLTHEPLAYGQNLH